MARFELTAAAIRLIPGKLALKMSVTDENGAGVVGLQKGAFEISDHYAIGTVIHGPTKLQIERLVDVESAQSFYTLILTNEVAVGELGSLNYPVTHLLAISVTHRRFVPDTLGGDHGHLVVDGEGHLVISFDGSAI